MRAGSATVVVVAWAKTVEMAAGTRTVVTKYATMVVVVAITTVVTADMAMVEEAIRTSVAEAVTLVVTVMLEIWTGTGNA
jgi:hypothetical protein